MGNSMRITTTITVFFIAMILIVCWSASNPVTANKVKSKVDAVSHAVKDTLTDSEEAEYPPRDVVN